MPIMFPFDVSPSIYLCPSGWVSYASQKIKKTSKNPVHCAMLCLVQNRWSHTRWVRWKERGERICVGARTTAGEVWAHVPYSSIRVCCHLYITSLIDDLQNYCLGACNGANRRSQLRCQAGRAHAKRLGQAIACKQTSTAGSWWLWTTAEALLFFRFSHQTHCWKELVSN